MMRVLLIGSDGLRSLAGFRSCDGTCAVDKAGDWAFKAEKSTASLARTQKAEAMMAMKQTKRAKRVQASIFLLERVGGVSGGFRSCSEELDSSE